MEQYVLTDSVNLTHLKKIFPLFFRDLNSTTSSWHSGHGINGIPLGPRGCIENAAAGMNDELESSPMAAGAGIHCRTAWLVGGWCASVADDASREPRAEEAVEGGTSSFRWSRIGGGATTCRGTRVRGSAGEGRRHRHLGMLSGPAREEGVGQIWAEGAFFPLGNEMATGER